MYWGKKFKFTKREKKEFKEKMSKIRIFCETNNITTDEYYNDAYYFEINVDKHGRRIIDAEK